MQTGQKRHYVIDHEHSAESLGIRPGQIWAGRFQRHHGGKVKVLAILSRSVLVVPVGRWGADNRRKRWCVEMQKFVAANDLVLDR